MTEMLHLYDTATREVREIQLREPGKIGIYLCGPTVYGPPHLGHGRATLVYDILRRYLEWSGLTVRLVSNITDMVARGRTSLTSVRTSGLRQCAN
ncbi:MAG: cysteinyl-tRNA synthetase [Actinomycetota bacterium]